MNPQWLNEDTLILRFGDDTDEQAIAIAAAWVEQVVVKPGVRDAVSALGQAMVVFAWPISPNEVDAVLAQATQVRPSQNSQQIEIQVCYEACVAPDLAAVAEHAGLTVEQTIQRHLASSPTVRAMGFAPGFGYLSPVDPVFDLPRRATPRTQVPAGSVAIAEGQTVIYPQASPGGWHLIGRSNAVLMSYAAQPQPLFRIGDQIQFVRIGLEALDPC